MRTYIGSICLVLFLATPLSSPALAEIPALLPVQGFLTDQQGTPINGPVVLQFALYESESAAAPFYSEPQSMTVQSGHFYATLGNLLALDFDQMAGMSDIWLGLAVNNQAEMSPRIRLATVPYTAYAQHAAETALLEGIAAAGFSLASHQHQLEDLASLPQDIGDGDNNTLGELDCQQTGDTAQMSGVDWRSGAQTGLKSVTAGTGLTGGGNVGDVTVAIDFTQVQSRVTASCDEGSAIKSIGDGTVSCTDDNLGIGTIRSVTTGEGLTGGAPAGDLTIAADASIQQLITGVCDPGSSIRMVTAEGGVVCQNDLLGVGTISGVTTTSDSGLSGGSSSGTPTLVVDPTDFNGSTPGVHSSGGVILMHGSTPETLDSLTITAPRAGKVMVMGTTNVLSFVDPWLSSEVFVGWDDDESGTPIGRVHGFFDDYNSQVLTSHWTFAVVAGTHTFHLRGHSRHDDEIDIQFSGTVTQAFFLPTDSE